LIVEDFMRYRTLGKTGLEVSEVSIGLWAVGGDAWGPVDDQESLAAMRAAFDAGVNLFDTADVYGRGRSEELVAQFLTAVPRDQVFVATKVGLWRGRQPNPYVDEQMVLEDCEASLRRLGVDYIDVYQDHVWWDENTEVFAGALQRLKEQGKARFVGLSANDHSYVRHFDEAIGGMDTLQLDYSMLNRGPEQETLRYCQDQGIGVIVRGPLAQGKLTGKFTTDTTFPEGDIRRAWTEGEQRHAFLGDLDLVEQLSFLASGRTLAQAALGFALAHPAVSTTIPGAKRPSQVQDNVAASDLPLSQEELARAREVLDQREELAAS
jgi:aryl-alcohol dehydrogenase-like predicted oxidoreductase